MAKISSKLSQIYNKISEGEEKGFLYYFLFLPLYLLSVLYGIGVRLRFFLYRIGLFKTGKLICKVISIGNITIGGSGKTPMAIYLAGRLREKGEKVVILSRGYKGKMKDTAVVSDGENILLGPEDAGDEPYLMAVQLKTVPVVVGRDRYKSGLYAVERFKPDVIILDDGFQHIRLFRDMDIVLVDGRRWFGNNHLFPLGTLREPLSGLKRASLIMIKGEPSAISHQLSAIGCPVISFVYKPRSIVKIIDGSKLPIDVLKGKKIAALSGIADPKSFKNTLEKLGALVIKEFAFPDHYAYTNEDVQVVTSEAAESDMVITTMKDSVKLKSFSINHPPIYALDIEVGVGDLEVFEKAVEFR